MLYAIAPFMIPKKPGEPAQVPLHAPVPPPGYYDRQPPKRRPEEDDDGDDRYIVDISGNREDDADKDDGAVTYQF